MRTTIDKAGRVVIPAAIRDRAGLVAGSELEIREDELGIRLERVALGPRLVRVGQRLVARPTVPETRQSPSAASAGRTKELSLVPDEEMPVDAIDRLEPSGPISATLARSSVGIP